MYSVPGINRFPYPEIVPDHRKYSLIDESDPKNADKYSNSNCFPTFVMPNGDTVFRGPLEGSSSCRIQRISNVMNNGKLTDIYQAYVGYDDLYQYHDEMYDVVLRNNQFTS